MDAVSKVHCIAAIDPDTKRAYRFGPTQIPDALDLLSSADRLVAHNCLGYDLPALKKLYGWVPTKNTEIRDTLVWSRLCFSDLKEQDMDSPDSEVQSLSGSNELSAWGARLGCRKSDYQGGWEEYSDEMMEYCLQDVKVLVRLYQHLLTQHTSEEALRLEQFIAHQYEGMSLRGTRFDTEAASVLVVGLQQQLLRIQGQLDEVIPPRREEMNTPAYWEMRWPDGSRDRFQSKSEAEQSRKQRKIKPKDCLLERGPNKVKLHPFKPNSTTQVRNYLVEQYDWVSPKLTKKGQDLLSHHEEVPYEVLAKQYGSTEEDVLRTLDWPEAQLFADFTMTNKVLGMVSEGQQAWQKKVSEDGRMRPRLISLGCITHRSAARSPNIQQIPAVVADKTTGHPVFGFDGRYGADCRSLFCASEGYIMVGMDLAGIEARMLAHYLVPFDNGAYVEQVLHGDIHQLNVDAIREYVGFTVSRTASKPMYYGKLYSIGAVKQGQVVVEASEEARADFKEREAYYTRYPDRITRHTYAQRRKIKMRPGPCAYGDIGEKVNLALEKGIFGLDRLIAATKERAKRGYLSPLDGRRIPIRKESAALNTLLQGSAGIVFKRAVCCLANGIAREGLDARLLLPVHDEIQGEVVVKEVEAYKHLALGAPRAAGNFYKLHIPIEGECKTGRNWAETH